jgi:RNA polymerase sigma-70 factor (ECF subfamily)
VAGLLRNPARTMNAPPDDLGGTDAVLVSQAGQGDTQAFALLYRRYVANVYEFSYHRLGSREAAEDATQTTFLRAYGSLKSCRDGDRFAGWLFAIARNVVNDSWRARQHVVIVADEWGNLPDGAESPEERAVRTDPRSDLRSARERCLTPAERDVLDLRMQELNDRQIATALGRSHGSVRVMQHRMLKKLRHCLEIATERKGAANG